MFGALPTLHIEVVYCKCSFAGGSKFIHLESVPLKPFKKTGFFFPTGVQNLTNANSPVNERSKGGCRGHVREQNFWLQGCVWSS